MRRQPGTAASALEAFRGQKAKIRGGGWGGREGSFEHRALTGGQAHCVLFGLGSKSTIQNRGIREITKSPGLGRDWEFETCDGERLFAEAVIFELLIPQASPETCVHTALKGDSGDGGELPWLDIAGKVD